jgi:amino acid permease
MVRRALILTAATIGSGVFALPYVVSQAGWLLTLIYFAVLGTVVVVAHAVYLKTLAAEGEKQRLLGLARKYFGALGFWFGFVAIVLGLVLSFVIFLILGTQFVRLIFPMLPYLPTLLLFWLLLAVPTLIGNRRVVSLEAISVLCVAGIMLFVFLSSYGTEALRSFPAVNLNNFFLPFSIVLFTLAGWTGVEPFYESNPAVARRKPWFGLALGTAFAILLYWLFAFGILRSAPQLTTDTVSGLLNWPVWKRDLLAAFGLFAVWTVAMPISHEIRNTLEKDLRWPHLLSRLLILGLPLAAVLLGFNSFLLVVGLVGGLFVGLQYLLIIAVARRALNLSKVQKALLDLISLVFLAAAVYEIATFIVK